MPAILNQSINLTPEEVADLFRQLNAKEQARVVKELERSRAGAVLLHSFRAAQSKVAHVPEKEWKREVDAAVHAVRRRGKA